MIMNILINIKQTGISCFIIMSSDTFVMALLYYWYYKCYKLNSAWHTRQGYYNTHLHQGF